jgi:hypothetical protein
VLLDYVEEIVIPAFVDDKLARGYGQTHFFFYETALVTLDDDPKNPVLGISGRFIKNTQLTREQRFDPKQGLIHEEASIPSAPSARFILVLNNHRLIYFPETAHAPDLATFKSTAISFLRIKHKEHINRRYEELKGGLFKVTKKELFQQNPSPTLEVLPISGEEAISNFIKRFSILKKIEFRIIEPNDEIDGADLFNDIRDFLRPLRPDSTKLEIRNPEGLDVIKAAPRIKAATETTNQEVRLSGLDHEGNNLAGDNHEFKVGAPIEVVPPTPRGLIQKLYATFTALQKDGTIRVPPPKESALRIVSRLRSMI